MEKKIFNPPAFGPPRGYTHAVSVAGAGRVIFVSGQVSRDAEGRVMHPGDLAAQTRQVTQHLITTLAQAGASAADVVKLNVYVVNYKPEDLKTIMEARRQFFPKEDPPASTLVGVTSLASEGLLVEIEAIAVAA